MMVFGIDFTSSPQRRKPIVCLRCNFSNSTLVPEKLDEWTTFDAFERVLNKEGPWIAGIDFPFGQSRKFIANIGWPRQWSDYVAHASSLGRQQFRAALDSYRTGRAIGDKEHRRRTDIAAGSISPQKLYGVPVALMFFEGSQRLLAANVTIPGLQCGDPDRIVVEAYPGVLARQLIGRTPYKHDASRRQTPAQHEARIEILKRISAGSISTSHELTVSFKEDLGLAADPSGDHLDALLCAIQAAWAWSKHSDGFGAPSPCDPMEGWIADPVVSRFSIDQ